jgi:hypothetical protein
MIYKMVYFPSAETEHYKNFEVVEPISKETIVMVYRNMSQNVVTISSSTVIKQLLTVRP